MTIRIQQPDGTAEDATSQQLIDIRTGLSVPSVAEATALADAKVQNAMTASTTVAPSATAVQAAIDAAVAGAGGVSDGDKGDVVVSGTGTVWTVDAAAITLAKMANLAQDQFIGRTTASTGVPQTATISAAARTVLDDASVGAMVDTLGGAAASGTGGLVRVTGSSIDLSNATGLPLTSGVTGDLPLSNLAQGSALSVLGVTGNATADNASIAAVSDHQVMRRSGTAVAFGAVNLASSAAVTGILPIANIATGTPDGTKFVKDDGTLAVPGSAITVQDEGTPLSTAATTLNFVGAGVTATGSGANKTITIPGAGTATITVKEDGTTVSAVVTALDFLGADFDVTESPSGEANIVVSSAIARTASVQPLDADLTAIAALTSAADKLLYSTGAGTWALADLSATARTLLDDTSTGAMLTTLGAQPSDATLTALAALTIAANSLSIGSGADAFSQVTFAANTFPARASTGNLVAKAITDFGLSLLDDADGAAVLATLGGTAATGTGGVVRATAPTISALTAQGITTYDGANVTTANAMGALAIDVTKGLNTKSISADSTFTFSGTPATANTWFQMVVTNTDTAPHILTFPSAHSFVTQAARTTCPIAASGRLNMVFRYNGSTYEVYGDGPYLNNTAATTAPGVGDDIADGYGPGSLWFDGTGNVAYWCESNGAGAAVWNSLGTASVGKLLIPVMAGGMSPSATGGCAALATIASASNQPDIQTLDFDATTEEYAQFAIPMPESWNEGTLTFAPIWSHASTTTNFGVVWSLQAVAVSNDDAIAVAFGTAVTSTDTGGTTNDLYVGPESSAMTVAGTPATADTVFFRIFRTPANGSDTMAIDARLHGIRLYYTSNAATDA